MCGCLFVSPPFGFVRFAGGVLFAFGCSLLSVCRLCLGCCLVRTNLGGTPPQTPPRLRRALRCNYSVATIKRSAEALKATSLEPTYPMLLARCPKATRNPATGEPVHKRAVYDVFRTMCYDEGAAMPREPTSRQQKMALSPTVQAKHLA